MWKKSDDFSAADLAKLMSSPQAQALAQLLQQMDAATLNQAAALASQGDAQGAKALLNPVLQDPKVKDLLQSREDCNG